MQLALFIGVVVEVELVIQLMVEMAESAAVAVAQLG